nr:MAG TPA: hypothetical protein [Caudoviricetes sp.]
MRFCFGFYIIKADGFPVLKIRQIGIFIRGEMQ